MSVLEKVKELRDVTGAGMQDCKNALKENDNNIEKSINQPTIQLPTCNYGDSFESGG